MSVRIYADFNNTDETHQVGLNTVGSLSDIEKVNIALREGMPVILYDEELEVWAILKRTPDGKHWMGIPDWSTRRYLK